jgi:hypothetical protein
MKNIVGFGWPSLIPMSLIPCIGGVMVSVLASNVIACETSSGQVKPRTYN